MDMHINLALMTFVCTSLNITMKMAAIHFGKILPYALSQIRQTSFESVKAIVNVHILLVEHENLSQGDFE